MENASKALLIAGGVFLAVMILSLIAYTATISGRMADEQNQRTKVEQITAFNKEYLAFNKKRMYGTDVITVVNKAINNNNSMLLNDVAEPYYINIEINITQEFKSTVYKIDNREEVATEEPVRTVSASVMNLLGINSQIFTPVMVPSNSPYRLGNMQGEQFVMDSEFVNFFDGYTEDIIEPDGDLRYTYKLYSALTSFKRAIFECTDYNYNDLTGRIESMTFTQINSFDNILQSGGH